jgi:hypothetical protein
MKAYIKREVNNAMWLIVDRSEKEDIDFSFTADYEIRDEDDKRGVAYPILEDEIEAIYEACKQFLVERGDDVETNE